MANKDYDDLTQASALDGSERVVLKQGSNSRRDTVKSLSKFTGKAVISILVTDPNGSAITTGDGKAYYRVPASLNGFNLTDCEATLDTAGTGGGFLCQLRRKRSGSDVDMLSTRISIDAGENDSTDAGTPPVINTVNDDVATADRIYFDFDGVPTGAKGASIEMTFERP